MLAMYCTFIWLVLVFAVTGIALVALLLVCTVAWKGRSFLLTAISNYCHFQLQPFPTTAISNYSHFQLPTITISNLDVDQKLVTLYHMHTRHLVCISPALFTHVWSC